MANIAQYRRTQCTPVFPAMSNNPGYLESPAFSARTETCFHNICFVFFFHLLLPLWNPVYRFFPPPPPLPCRTTRDNNKRFPSEGHKHGRRKSTKTSGVHFCSSTIYFSLVNYYTTTLIYLLML